MQLKCLETLELRRRICLGLNSILHGITANEVYTEFAGCKLS